MSAMKGTEIIKQLESIIKQIKSQNGNWSEIEKDIVLESIRAVYSEVKTINSEFIPSSQKLQDEKPAIQKTEITENLKEQKPVAASLILEIQDSQNEVNIVAKEPVNIPKKEQEIIAEKLNQKSLTINDSIEKASKQQYSSETIQGKAIQDLFKAIGINDRFLYTRELFNNNAALYHKSIEAFNEMNSIEESITYINNHFHWDEQNEHVISLLNLLKRRYRK